jgi:hypothetical protein
MTVKRRGSGGQLFVNDLEAIEIEQFGPESQLVLFAHERSSLKMPAA